MNFDAVLDLEFAATCSGVSGGLAAAEAKSMQSGFALGYTTGSALSLEVRSYEGFVQFWEMAAGGNPVPPRVGKAMLSLRELVNRFPRTQSGAAAVDFMHLLGQIRAKFRQVCAGLNISPPPLPLVPIFLAGAEDSAPQGQNEW